MIRIFRHVDCEGPGYLADYLTAHGYGYELVAVDQGAPVNTSPEGCTGLVFMGGHMSANDDLAWIGDELELIRRAARAGVPMLGHCLGAQLIAKALGGEVVANPAQEIGWFDVERVASDAGKDWLGDLPDRFEVFHWHGEAFSLPPGAESILTNENTLHQGFVVGNSLALQCHVEMTEELVRTWGARFGDALDTSVTTVQSVDEMTADLTRRVEGLHRVADGVYERWLQEVERFAGGG